MQYKYKFEVKFKMIYAIIKLILIDFILGEGYG